jgi:hypothetical protein
VTPQVEFVYNNGGYIGQTQSDQYYGTWDDIEPADTVQTFQKKRGEPASPLRRHRWSVCIHMPCCRLLLPCQS